MMMFNEGLPYLEDTAGGNTAGGTTIDGIVGILAEHRWKHLVQSQFSAILSHGLARLGTSLTCSLRQEMRTLLLRLFLFHW